MTIGSPRFIGMLPPTDPRWEEALCKTSHDLFHLPGYLSASAPHEGGDPLLFLLDLGEHGMLVPLIRRSLSEFGETFTKYCDVSSPYGYPGPLCWGDGWQDLLPEMHGQFCDFLKQENVVSLFVRLNPFVGPPAELLAKLGGVIPQGPTVFIDLRDPKLSWSGINASNRRFITQALQQGYEVRFDQWETIEQVIVAYYETMQRLKASPFYFFPRSYFHQLRDNTADHFHLATVYTPGGEVAGGCFFSEVGGLMQYFLLGTFEAYLEASPSKLLINALRLWGIERGHHTLNLGGGVGAKQDGLFDFKIRLSKKVANFSTFNQILLPETYEALTQSQDQRDQGIDYFPIYRKARLVPNQTP